jgi:hypothetical protein
MIAGDSPEYTTSLESLEAGSLTGVQVDVPISNVQSPLVARRIRWIQWSQIGVLTPAEETQGTALIIQDLIAQRVLRPSEAAALAAGHLNQVRVNPLAFVAAAVWGLACLTIGVNLVRPAERHARRTLARLEGGCCPKCNYPMQGVSGICPECGTDSATSLRVATACLTGRRPPAG